MIWENGIETCILSYVKWIANPVSMHETGNSGLVQWDELEEWEQVLHSVKEQIVACTQVLEAGADGK